MDHRTDLEVHCDASFKPDYASPIRRILALAIDCFFVILISIPYSLLLIMIHSMYPLTNFQFNLFQMFFNWGVLPLIIIAMWRRYQATPGKYQVKCIIVDANTLGKPTTKQFILRYAGYMLLFVSFGVSFLWAFWDKRNQTWHDKLANTVVINRPVPPELLKVVEF